MLNVCYWILHVWSDPFWIQSLWIILDHVNEDLILRVPVYDSSIFRCAWLNLLFSLLELRFLLSDRPPYSRTCQIAIWNRGYRFLWTPVVYIPISHRILAQRSLVRIRPWKATSRPTFPEKPSLRPFTLKALSSLSQGRHSLVHNTFLALKCHHLDSLLSHGVYLYFFVWLKWEI